MDFAVLDHREALMYVGTFLCKCDLREVIPKPSVLILVYIAIERYIGTSLMVGNFGIIHVKPVYTVHHSKARYTH
jgi:hypothetical protein